MKRKAIYILRDWLAEEHYLLRGAEGIRRGTSIFLDRTCDKSIALPIFDYGHDGFQKRFVSIVKFNKLKKKIAKQYGW